MFLFVIKGTWNLRVPQKPSVIENGSWWTKSFSAFHAILGDGSEILLIKVVSSNFVIGFDCFGQCSFQLVHWDAQVLPRWCCGSSLVSASEAEEKVCLPPWVGPWLSPADRLRYGCRLGASEDLWRSLIRWCRDLVPSVILNVNDINDGKTIWLIWKRSQVLTHCFVVITVAVAQHSSGSHILIGQICESPPQFSTFPSSELGRWVRQISNLPMSSHVLNPWTPKGLRVLLDPVLRGILLLHHLLPMRRWVRLSEIMVKRGESAQQPTGTRRWHLWDGSDHCSWAVWRFGRKIGHFRMFDAESHGLLFSGFRDMFTSGTKSGHHLVVLEGNKNNRVRLKILFSSRKIHRKIRWITWMWGYPEPFGNWVGGCSHNHRGGRLRSAKLVREKSLGRSWGELWECIGNINEYQWIA